MKIDKIELKNVRYSAAASEETAHFSATVYLDGSRWGTVSNGGTGGCNRYDPRELEDILDRHAKTLPDVTLTLGDSVSTFPQSADLLIGAALDRYLAAQDIKRAKRNRILFVRDAKLMQTHKMSVEEMLRFSQDAERTRKELRAERVLNFLPIEEAIDAYIELAKPA